VIGTTGDGYEIGILVELEPNNVAPVVGYVRTTPTVTWYV
jgi:hypothetical protein